MSDEYGEETQQLIKQLRELAEEMDRYGDTDVDRFATRLRGILDDHE